MTIDNFDIEIFDRVVDAISVAISKTAEPMAVAVYRDMTNLAKACVTVALLDCQFYHLDRVKTLIAHHVTDYGDWVGATREAIAIADFGFLSDSEANRLAILGAFDMARLWLLEIDELRRVGILPTAKTGFYCE